MSAEPVLKHLHASLRGGGSSAAWDLGDAATHQQLLGAASLRQDGAADLADDLVERAEQLAGSKQATQRLLGLQLLRTVLVHCHRHAFLSRHAQWAALLLATLRGEQQRSQKQGQGQETGPDAASAPSAAAREVCACLAVYFTRLGRMLEVPGVRRDGAAAASKVAAQLLQQGQKTQAQQAAAPLLTLPQGQQALLAALTALPASFRQHQKALEAQLLPLLMQQGSGAGEGRSLLAACAAALPRIAGDGSSWSAFCQRLLASAHQLADVLLLGLDDAHLAAAARAALDPAAEPLPLLPPSGGAVLGSDAYAAAWGQLGAVLQALQALLGASHPAPVPVPAGGLLLLVSRLLSVDDRGAAAASSRFPLLCLRLPRVQAAALGLLQRLLAACGSAAAPYFVAAARLLAEALQRSAAGGGCLAMSAQVRCQLYGATRQLLLVAGVGAVRPLATALLHAAAAELYGQKQKAGAAAEDGPVRKKAKRSRQAAAEAALDAEAAASAPLDDRGAASQLTELAVQAAALQALQALCCAGAPLLPAQQRRQLDDLAAHVAATSAGAGRQLSSDAESAVSASLAALQLAAYRLLLATLLAPAPHRPPHLAAALRLFRQGCGGGAAGGAVLAPFCRSALLSCEALLHPRALPPPGPVRRVLPTAADDDDGEEGGAPLGMPRFWSGVDAALLLAQEQARLAAQPAQPAPLHTENAHGGAAERTAGPMDAAAGAAGTDEEMAEAEAAQSVAAAAAAPPPAAAPAPDAGVPTLQAQAPVSGAAPAALQGPPMSSMAAMPAATAPAAPAAPPAAPAPAALPAPAAAAPPASKPAFASAAAAAPTAAGGSAAAAAAAAAEESDSEGSLPEIDSGEGSSSGEESDGEVASQ